MQTARRRVDSDSRANMVRPPGRKSRIDPSSERTKPITALQTGSSASGDRRECSVRSTPGDESIDALLASKTKEFERRFVLKHLGLGQNASRRLEVQPATGRHFGESVARSTRTLPVKFESARLACRRAD